VCAIFFLPKPNPIHIPRRELLLIKIYRVIYEERIFWEVILSIIVRNKVLRTCVKF